MIIGLTGRIAAGKETLTQFLRDKGFVYLESSKPLNDELVKRDKKYGGNLIYKSFADLEKFPR